MVNNKNEGSTVPRVTLSLNKKEIQKLKDVADVEERPFSRQVVYMMNFYVENTPNLKKHLEDREKERKKSSLKHY